MVIITLITAYLLHTKHMLTSPNELKLARILTRSCTKQPCHNIIYTIYIVIEFIYSIQFKSLLNHKNTFIANGFVHYLFHFFKKCRYFVDVMFAVRKRIDDLCNKSSCLSVFYTYSQHCQLSDNTIQYTKSWIRSGVFTFDSSVNR